MDNELYNLIYSIFDEVVNSKHIINQNGKEILQTAYSSPKYEMSVDYQIEHELPQVQKYLSQFKNELTMAEVINEILNENHLEIREVVRKMDYRQARQTIYRLANFSNSSSAKKDTLICLAFCTNASLKQLERLLRSSGYVLTENNRDDMIVKYCFDHQKDIEFYEGIKDQLEVHMI